MHGNETRMLRGAVLVGTALVPAAAVGGWLVAGARAALGAGLGALLATGFLALTALAIRLSARRGRDLMIPAVLGAYLVKFALLIVLLFLLRSSTLLDVRAFALAVVAVTVVLLGIQSVSVWRAPLVTSAGAGSGASSGVGVDTDAGNGEHS